MPRPTQATLGSVLMMGASLKICEEFLRGGAQRAARASAGSQEKDWPLGSSPGLYSRPTQPS
ncbi:hypothetical protein SVIOM342S_05788 [Streptomyces violaceorubidus]